MNKTNPNLILSSLENISLLHMRICVEPVWNQYPHWQQDPLDSIRLFLLGYAFEHQGRSQDFGPAAVDAVTTLQRQPINPDSAQEAWQALIDRLTIRGLNPALNPLCPRGFQYKRNGANLRTRKFSLLEFVLEKLNGQALVPWACQCIAVGQIQQAHAALCEINGIGPKIASLFLRDVAVRLKVTFRPEDSRHLLQPVDVWVRSVAHLWSGQNSLSDIGCAKYLVSKSTRPEQLNQGIWYFCARMADSSRYLVRQSLADPTALQVRIQQHLGRLRIDSAIADEFAQACSAQRGQP